MNLSKVCALLVSSACLQACATRVERKPVAASSVSGSASKPSGLRVVAANGATLASFDTLTRTVAVDDFIASHVDCPAGEVAWIAGSRGSSARLVLCLPEGGDVAPRDTPAFLSLSRQKLLVEDRRTSLPSPISAWWDGRASVSATVRDGHVEVDGSVTMSQKTAPASFMGLESDAEVRIEGTAELVRTRVSTRGGPMQ